MAKTITIEKEVDKEHLEIVQMISEGLTVAQISEKMGINIRTAEAKIGRIKNTYNVTTLPELVSFFFRNKLIK
jgi:DNA-binding NarL/FixJ family response regulator